MTTSDGQKSSRWISWFCSVRGNEFFCDVDIDFIKDRFNLTGLNEQVPHYRRALSLILDEDDDSDLNTTELIAQAANVLYGLIHARYVMSPPGAAKVLKKSQAGDYGKCPRVFCGEQLVLPVGLSDAPGEGMVKVYCPKCHDIYHPRSPRHHQTDGAYFGTGLPHMIFMDRPDCRPKKPNAQFVPRLYGFKIHPMAYQLQSLITPVPSRIQKKTIPNKAEK